LIGGCELVVDREHGAGILGYSLARPHWGQGYATEASVALVRLGFESLGMHRISATTDVRNVASWRIMEKLGMRREAHLREHVRQRGQWRDSFLYAILERDWFTL
jgi:RimJ/RimL family protein N-acetyltransferase